MPDTFDYSTFDDNLLGSIGDYLNNKGSDEDLLKAIGISPDTTGNWDSPSNAQILKDIGYTGTLDPTSIASFAKKLFINPNGTLNFPAIGGVAGGVLGASGLGNAKITPTGYQGGIPQLTASQPMLTAPPVGRRPGSSGINYGTGVQYKDKNGNIVSDTSTSVADLAAAAAGNPFNQTANYGQGTTGAGGATGATGIGGGINNASLAALLQALGLAQGSGAGAGTSVGGGLGGVTTGVGGGGSGVTTSVGGAKPSVATSLADLKASYDTLAKSGGKQSDLNAWIRAQMAAGMKDTDFQKITGYGLTDIQKAMAAAQNEGKGVVTGDRTGLVAGPGSDARPTVDYGLKSQGYSRDYSPQEIQNIRGTFIQNQNDPKKVMQLMNQYGVNVKDLSLAMGDNQQGFDNYFLQAGASKDFGGMSSTPATTADIAYIKNMLNQPNPLGQGTLADVYKAQGIDPLTDPRVLEQARQENARAQARMAMTGAAPYDTSGQQNNQVAPWLNPNAAAEQAAYFAKVAANQNAGSNPNVVVGGSKVTPSIDTSNINTQPNGPEPGPTPAAPSALTFNEYQAQQLANANIQQPNPGDRTVIGGGIVTPMAPEPVTIDRGGPDIPPTPAAPTPAGPTPEEIQAMIDYQNAYSSSGGAKAGGLIGHHMAQGGIAGLKTGRYLQGATDGMADKLPTTIDGHEPAALSHGEFVVPADVVSHLGNGNSDAGAKKLYQMMDKIRMARTGTKKQGKEINPDKFMPGGLARAYAEGGRVKGYSGTDPTGSLVTAGVTGTEQNLSNWVGPYASTMLGQAQALANTPYQAYTGPLTAGASDLQTQAFNTAANLPAGGGMATDFAQRAGNMSYTPTTTGFDATQVQQYMNPYLQASLNPQLEEARRQSDITAQTNNAAMTKAGAFGGGRQAILTSENQRNLGTNLANITGQGYNTAYTNAMQQFNADQNRKMQENQFGANLGLQGLQTGISGANTANQIGINNLTTQAGLGATQRGIESEGIAADKAQFEAARQDPYTKLQFQQSMLNGLPITATNYNMSTPSTLQQTIAGAGGLAGLFGNKTNLTLTDVQTALKNLGINI